MFNIMWLIALFVLSLFISLLATPLVKKIALKNNLVDMPGERKIHQNPIPLFGGLAIILSFYVCFVGLLILGFVPNIKYISLLLGGGSLVALGLWDGILGTQAYIKMGILFVIGFLVAAFGQTIFISHNNIINIIFSGFWIAGITNAFNYLDNMDGLSAGLATISALLFFIVSLLVGQYDVAFIAIILAGACLGFLKYNFNPASIFMGDVGSYFIGFILAIIGSKLFIPIFWDLAFNLRVTSLHTISFVVPLMILGVPIFDTFLVTIMRPLANRKIVQAGKDHSSHRLHNLGFSHKATVAIIWGIQIVLGASSIALLRANTEQFFALLTVILVMLVFCWLFLARVKVYA